MELVNKKTIFLAVLTTILIIAIVKIALFSSPSRSPSASLNNQAAVFKPTLSETLKAYSDPSGFTFNYPDNLSLTNNEVTDASYAEVQLSAKGVEGSLILKVTDSKFLSTDQWVKSIKDLEGQPKEVKLGSLRALEIKTAGKIKLASVDQGVTFSIDLSNSQNDFWMKAYNKILAEFTFAQPAQDSVSSSDGSSDVSFEGEEVVE